MKYFTLLTLLVCGCASVPDNETAAEREERELEELYWREQKYLEGMADSGIDFTGELKDWRRMREDPFPENPFE